jgi:PAS domain S-box-containing protein
MAADDREDQELRSAAFLNATSILHARQRAERELLAAKDALERKTEELGQSLARIRATLESTTDAIFVSTREGVLSDYNERFTSLWKIPPAVMATRDREEIHRAMAQQVVDPAAFLRRLDEIRETTPAETFETVELVDGRVIERHSRVQFVGERNIGRVWSFHDITVHRRAAEELREQREWFRVTLSSIGDAVITTDLQSRITFLNPVAEKMTGWSNAEAFGLPLDQVFCIVHEETGQRVENPIAAALRQGATVALANHTALVSRNGTEIAIEDSAAPIRDASGRVAGAVMVFHDVTDRRRAEEELRDNEARLRVSLETAALGTWQLEVRTGVVTLDERCRELYGLAGEPTIDMATFVAIAYADDSERRHQLFKDVIAGKLERYELEFRVQNGGRWVKASAKSVRDSTGAILRVIGAVQDITSLVEARATTEERRRELERLVVERTASLQYAIEQMEEFSYSVSHDLRAPLRSIQSYAQAVIEDYGERIGPEGLEFLQRIVNAGGRMDRLTRDVLTYSKISRGSAPVVPLPLDRIVAETIEQYAPTHQHDGTITVERPLLPVVGNEPLLVQAISNLLANALKFVPEEIVPRVRIWTEPRGHEVRLWIEDNGIGIAPEYQHRIWRMFERVHPRDRYEGTGIGLAITRKATERMDGTIGVESDGKRGSRFWIQLPAG